jgi:hypothetical protein
VSAECHDRACHEHADRHQPTSCGTKGEQDRQTSWRAAALDGADERREQVLQRERQHEADEYVLQVVDCGRQHGTCTDDEGEGADPVVKVRLPATQCLRAEEARLRGGGVLAEQRRGGARVRHDSLNSRLYKRGCCVREASAVGL